MSAAGAAGLGAAARVAVEGGRGAPGDDGRDTAPGGRGSGGPGRDAAEPDAFFGGGGTDGWTVVAGDRRFGITCFAVGSRGFELDKVDTTLTQPAGRAQLLPSPGDARSCTRDSLHVHFDMFLGA